MVAALAQSAPLMPTSNLRVVAPGAALRRLVATRYVTALREGGSVPAVVEADDGALYVAKFRGAAQGARALVAELIAGELARAAGLPIPELALIEVEAALGTSEPHQEIRELLIASAGLNLAMAYLPGSIGYDVAARLPVTGAFASAVVALDVFVANVDRTARNPNLLWWQDALWLIDHGAALYWHHGFDGSETDDAVVASARRPFARAGEHVLLPAADGLAEAGRALIASIDEAAIVHAVDVVPGAWMAGPGDPGRLRDAYLLWLRQRRAAFPQIMEEVERVRAAGV